MTFSSKMTYKCFSLLPVCACFVQFSTILASYLAGIFDEDRQLSYIPYPSDLSIKQPEKGIFTVGISLSSIFTFTVILVRAMQINTFYPRLCIKLNILSFTAGLLMIIGMNLVPAFSLIDNPTIHYIGAFMYFTAGFAYMISQTHISRLHLFNHTVCIVHYRITVCCIAALCPIAYMLARFLAPLKDDRFYIPQCAEWTLAILILAFLGSFTWDFSKIRIRLNSYEVSARSRAGSEKLFVGYSDRETNI